MVLKFMLSVSDIHAYDDTDHDTDDDADDLAADDDSNDATDGDTDDDADGGRGNLCPIKAQGSSALSRHD